MKNLKEQLIRLGYENPELRDDLRPVLNAVTKQSSREEVDLYNNVYEHIMLWVKRIVERVVEVLPQTGAIQSASQLPASQMSAKFKITTTPEHGSQTKEATVTYIEGNVFVDIDGGEIQTRYDHTSLGAEIVEQILQDVYQSFGLRF